MKGMRGRRRAGRTGEKRLALELLILAALTEAYVTPLAAGLFL